MSTYDVIGYIVALMCCTTGIWIGAVTDETDTAVAAPLIGLVSGILALFIWPAHAVVAVVLGITFAIRRLRGNWVLCQRNHPHVSDVAARACDERWRPS